MYPTSEALNKAVRRPHKIVTAVHVYTASGELITDQLQIESGFVRVDDNREVRRRFTARLMDYSGELTPREVQDIFHPLAGNEFRAYRGVLLNIPSGTMQIGPPYPTFTRSSIAVRDDGVEIVANTPRILDGVIRIEEPTTNVLPNDISRGLASTTLGSNTATTSTEQTWEGTSSRKCTYQDDLRIYVAAWTAQVQANTTYAFSLYVWVPSNYNGGGLSLFAAGTAFAGTAIANVDMALRDQWQRIRGTATSGTNLTSATIHIRTTGTNPTAGRFIYVDGVQVEVKNYVTSWHPGTQTRQTESLIIPLSVMQSGWKVEADVFLNGTWRRVAQTQAGVRWLDGVSGATLPGPVIDGSRRVVHQWNVRVDNIRLSNSNRDLSDADQELVRDKDTLYLLDFNGGLVPQDSTGYPRTVTIYKEEAELVPQGVFDMADVNISDSREGYFMEIIGYDRARDVMRRRFVNNYVVPVASNFGEAIKQMILFKRPHTTFDFVPVDFLTPQLVFGGSGETGGGNAWDAGQKMAESIGMDLYFNIDGVCTLRPVTSLSDNFAHVHYHETEDDPNQVLFVDRRLSDEDTFNHVVVRGESTSNESPVKGEAWDDDPKSATYINGPYGDIPTFLTSPFVRTEGQAIELARAQLNKKLGLEETVRIISIVHPGHEIGDIIHIERERSGIDDNFIIDQFTMPLESQQALNIGVRSRRVR